jgi:hypothetical protein
VVKIGVDSSGHVKNPPIWIIAARRSRKKGQVAYSIHISKEKHKELEASCKNWYEKVSAILIYKVVVPIFYEGDAIAIDSEFQGLEGYVEGYLRRLFQQTYPRKPLMANPNIFFIPEKHSPEVKEAHIKSQRLRHKEVSIIKADPSIEKELGMLE